MENEEKLKALTNEPVTEVFGGETYTLKRPTIKDYKKIRAFMKEHNVTQGRLDDDDAIDFGTFFIASLLLDPKYTQEELEDKILITDLPKLSEVMEKLGFTKPRTALEEKPEEVSEANSKTLIGGDSIQPS